MAEDDKKPGATGGTGGAKGGTGGGTGGGKTGAKPGARPGPRSGTGASSAKAAGKATPGRRARHSAQKKEPVTIDLEPAKSEPPRAKKAETAAAPAPAKAASAKAGPTKAASAKAASAGAMAGDTKADDRKPADTKAETKPADGSGVTPSPKPASADAKAAPAGSSDDKDAAKPATAAAPVATKGSVPATGAKASSTPADPAKSSARPEPKSEAKPAAKPAPAAAPAPSNDAKGAGFGGLLAAGIVGGAVTLGGAWALGAFDTDSADIETLRTELGQRIDTVAGSVPTAPDDALTREDVDAAIQAALAARAADGSADLDPRIATLQEELAATRSNLAALQQSIAAVGEGATDGTALAALAARVADLDTRVVAATDAASGQAVPTEQDIAAIADQAVSTRVETLEQRLTAGDSRVDAVEAALNEQVGNAVQSFQDRLNAIDTRLGELGSQATRNGEQVAALDTRLGELATNLETGLSQVRESLGASADTLRTELTGRIDTEIAGLNQTLTTLQETTGSQSEQLSTQDERLARIAEQVADTDPERRAATALALANLRTRIDDGEAYATELALVRRTNPKIDLTPLDGTAQTGIPTLAGLQNRFDAAAERIREAVRSTPDAGVDGLLANLRSAFEARPLDGVPGQDVDATIGAIRQNLADGDLATALVAWEALPEAGRQASSAWHNDLLARMKAKNFLSEALASLLEETGG